VAVLGPRVKRISVRSFVQHLSISIGVTMSEVIFVTIANIMARSIRSSISRSSISWGMGIQIMTIATMGVGVKRISMVVAMLCHQFVGTRL